jgi:choline-sulfatase
MLHGQSLVPLLAATDLASWRSAVLVQSNNSHADASPASWARTIRTSRHRYTRHLDGGGEQLFDLEADPDEQLNLAYHPDHQALRNQLLYELMDLSVRDAYPNSPRGLYSIGAW